MMIVVPQLTRDGAKAYCGIDAIWELEAVYCPMAAPDIVPFLLAEETPLPTPDKLGSNPRLFEPY